MNHHDDNDRATKDSLLWRAVEGVPDGRWQQLTADAMVLLRLAVAAGDDPETVLFDARTRAVLAGDLDRARVFGAMATKFADTRVLADVARQW